MVLPIPGSPRRTRDPLWPSLAALTSRSSARFSSSRLIRSVRSSGPTSCSSGHTLRQPYSPDQKGALRPCASGRTEDLRDSIGSPRFLPFGLNRDRAVAAHGPVADGAVYPADEPSAFTFPGQAAVPLTGAILHGWPTARMAD